MQNEILLILSLFLTYAAVLFLFKLFKEQGLYLWTIAFGMEMTLGNILFASTFLVTDILSELYGKKEAQHAVWMGIATSIVFIFISQSWMLYLPNENDFASPAIRTVFSNTPRLMIVGIAVYVIVQLFDVWAYHKWWEFTSQKFGDRKKFLWLRNNGSTLISQLLNTVLFTWGAFVGTHNTETLISIAFASYLIFIVTSLADTPFVYLARYLKEKNDTYTQT